MRKLNTRFFVIAGIITTVIFVLGLLLGIVIESTRVSYIESRYRDQRINYNSLQLQYLYLSSLQGREGCPAFSAALDNNIKDLEKTRIRLEKYIEEGIIHTEDFNLLKREYMISQLNYWMLSKKMREMCKSDFVSIIYFHSKNCRKCSDQGVVLDYLKRMFGDRLLIFAIDADFVEEPMVSILVDTYNVTETPAIIIEDQKLVGFQSKDSLLENICGHLRDKPDSCT